MDAIRDQITEWGYALSQTLQGQLDTGSMGALAVVFAAGVLTSFTPCVFPMIPVTVSFIGGSSDGRRGRTVSLLLFYVLGMALVYSSLGVIAPLLGKTFGSFTRNPWIFGGVGLLFVLMSVFMSDLLTIPVPRFFSGVQTAGARRGGYGGAVLMGLAAGFVAAPCTAPVVGGLLLFVARTRDVLWGGTLLFVFAIGLSTILVLAGMFSGFLASLPRAGVWMKWIKIGFAVILLGVGVVFLWQAVGMLMRGGGS